jgi:hypothetical protein
MGTYCTSVSLCVAPFSRDRSAIYQWSCELFFLLYNNPIKVGWIFIKFDVEIVPLEAAVTRTL